MLAVPSFLATRAGPLLFQEDRKTRIQVFSPFPSGITLPARPRFRPAPTGPALLHSFFRTPLPRRGYSDEALQRCPPHRLFSVTECFARCGFSSPSPLADWRQKPLINWSTAIRTLFILRLLFPNSTPSLARGDNSTLLVAKSQTTTRIPEHFGPRLHCRACPPPSRRRTVRPPCSHETPPQQLYSSLYFSELN